MSERMRMKLTEISAVLEKIVEDSVGEGLSLGSLLSDSRFGKAVMVRTKEGWKIISCVNMYAIIGNGRKYKVCKGSCFNIEWVGKQTIGDYYVVMFDRLTYMTTPVGVVLEKVGIMKELEEEIRSVLRAVNGVGRKYVGESGGKNDIDIYIAVVMKLIDPRPGENCIVFTDYDVVYVPMLMIKHYLTGGNDHGKSVFVDYLKKRLDIDFKMSVVLNDGNDLVVFVWGKQGEGSGDEGNEEGDDVVEEIKEVVDTYDGLV